MKVNGTIITTTTIMLCRELFLISVCILDFWSDHSFQEDDPIFQFIMSVSTNNGLLNDCFYHSIRGYADFTLFRRDSALGNHQLIDGEGWSLWRTKKSNLLLCTMWQRKVTVVINLRGFILLVQIYVFPSNRFSVILSLCQIQYMTKTCFMVKYTQCKDICICTLF